LPPEGSGRFGFVLAADFLNAEPVPFAAEALAAINFLLFALNCDDLFDVDFLGIFLEIKINCGLLINEIYIGSININN